MAIKQLLSNEKAKIKYSFKRCKARNKEKLSATNYVNYNLARPYGNVES